MNVHAIVSLIQKNIRDKIHGRVEQPAESYQEEEKEQIDTSSRPILRKEDSWQVQMNLFAQMEEF